MHNGAGKRFEKTEIGTNGKQKILK